MIFFKKFIYKYNSFVIVSSTKGKGEIYKIIFDNKLYRGLIYEKLMDKLLRVIDNFKNDALTNISISG